MNTSPALGSPLPEPRCHARTIAEQIAGALPEHDHYVEIFGGSLDVLLAKPAQGIETVNDTDRALLMFWKVLRERPFELARACALSPHSRAEHSEALLDSGSHLNVYADREIEAARRVWVQSCQSKTAWPPRARPDWRQWVGAAASVGDTMPDAMQDYVERMAAAAQRLHRVSLECRSPSAVINEFSARRRACLYVDMRPGHGLRSSWAPKALDTEALLAALRPCKSRVVVRTLRSQCETMPSAWTSLTIQGGAAAPANNSAGDTVLWSNRPLVAQQSLFEVTTPPGPTRKPARS